MPGAVIVAHSHEPLSYSVDGARGPISLRYFAPPYALRSYFGSLYIFAVDMARYADVTRADVPQLRFMLTGGGDYHFHDGRSTETPEICLLGPTMGATRFILDRPSHVLGVSLLPAGWLALQGEDASLWTDRARDMAACPTGDLHVGLLERLRTMDDPASMADEVWKMLSGLLRPLPSATWGFLHTVDAWLTGEASPRVEELVRESGLSARQVARLTRKLYGAPPKLLARKYRALRCSARIAIDRENWQTLCEDGTFYDQSHFIREIRHFIGLTPHQLLTEPSAVAQLTMLRRSLGGDVAALNRMS
ncbi:helix-turn-helix domain-containing protein [Sphingobium sp. AN641]|uniref:helix-turn-helix transcriptional regulator n=1 Tax=Sphingobium sp. AN641 TaxID=3133443 RepID=UPI0030BB223B